jgi:hypothetical protein
MKNLKTALKANKIEDYMSNISVSDFIKDYESLDIEELKKFININTKSTSKDWVNFSTQNIPLYIEK